MHQLLEPAWWLSYAGTVAPWYLWCLLASLVALPICLRFFRGLGDGGASLAPGIGLILLSTLSWFFALEWFTGDKRAALVRLLLIGAGSLASIACAIRLGRGGIVPPSHRVLYLLPGCLFVLGFLWLPHGLLSALGALLIMAGVAVALWASDRERLVRDLRRVAVPAIAAQLLFLTALLFFANVRSYIPYATFDRGLHLAEKWGNYTHLSAIYNSSTLPPRDPWFNGEYTNYYYGGHLLTATLGKASGTPQPIAFNLGLATVFALTIAMGFGVVNGLVHKRPRLTPLAGSVPWHHGMGWGLFGAAAIGLFGNLDPIRQHFTRDLDWSVRQRVELQVREAQERLKLQTGVPAEVAFALHAIPGLEGIPAEVARQLLRVEANERALQALQERAQSILGGEFATRRERQDALLATLVPNADVPIYRLVASVNAVELEETLTQLIVAGREQEAVARVTGLRPDPRTKTILERLSAEAGRMVTPATASDPGAVERITALLADPANEEGVRALLSDEPVALRAEWDEAAGSGNPQSLMNLVEIWADIAIENERAAPGAGALFRELQELRPRRTSTPATPLLVRHLGPQPPVIPRNIQTADVRWTWANLSTLDFWSPSRAIKSSPPGVRESGTITEFPYFSAILGDHHPHHFALPWALALMAACTSLLRKNGRGLTDDATWLRRSWPELVALAFLIGTVFSVNIWDAVVFGPMIGIAICLARQGVSVGTHWRWIGFVGFTILLLLVAGVLSNAAPGRAPLFQDFRFFALAVGLLFPGIPLVLWLQPHRPWWQVAGGCAAGALGLVFAGALLAPGAMGDGAAPPLGNALRDALVLLVGAGIAATWTLQRPHSWGNWWYASGAVYMAVGVTAILLTLPFKLFFVSPLEPALKMFAEIAPPILGHELSSARGAFWANFWRASPINPFPANIRSTLWDFHAHWGLFFIPILLYGTRCWFSAFVRTDGPRMFMVTGAALAVLALARVYLGYWPGAICLALVVLALWYAVTFRGRTDAPVWALLAGAFAWCWFVEALHFDDDYSGTYERYNTPFKIFYPLWPVFAAGMVVSVREGLGRFRCQLRAPAALLANPSFWVMVAIIGLLLPSLAARLLPATTARFLFFVIWIPLATGLILVVLAALEGRTRGWGARVAEELSRLMTRWPAVVAAAFIAAIGMLYPIGATVTRTRDFFTWPLAGSMESRLPQRAIYTERTLDAIAHYAEFPEYRQDWKAWRWLRENTPPGTFILEHAAADAYAQTGRMVTGSGRLGIINWKHHQAQWRGRAKAAYPHLKRVYYNEVRLPNDLASTFRADLPQAGPELTPEVQRDLRLAPNATRLQMLRALYPGANLHTLLRLRRSIERADISMASVMDVMLAHALAMYQSEDEAEVRRLFARYGVEYVVVGAVERAPSAHGANVADRFRRWGFQEVYDSGQDLLPDEPIVTEPTLVFRLPEAWKEGTR